MSTYNFRVTYNDGSTEDFEADADSLEEARQFLIEEYTLSGYTSVVAKIEEQS